MRGGLFWVYLLGLNPGLLERDRWFLVRRRKPLTPDVGRDVMLVAIYRRVFLFIYLFSFCFFTHDWTASGACLLTDF